MSPTHALLGLLLDQPHYGYELKRRIDQEFAPFWRMDWAQLYRSLAKVEGVGWVKQHRAASAVGPDRKVYTITPRGRAALEDWLAEPAQDRAEFLVKVRLASAGGLPLTVLFETQRHYLEGARAERLASQRAARESGDAARLLLADAALRDADAALGALELAVAILPHSRTSSATRGHTGLPVITGSDDPLLTRLAQLTPASLHVVGSLGGLLALRQHETDVAGIHLLDAETGEYNTPFVKHLAPEDDVVLVNLAVRENGLMLASGNPKNIRTLRDLTRPGVRFINRQYGAGTRLLLYSKLRAARLDPRAIRDWERTVGTHDAVAAAIAALAADVGPGLRAVASAWGLDFIPLGEERYDLVIPRAELESPRLDALLTALKGKDFRRAASEFQGYDLARTGRVVARIK